MSGIEVINEEKPVESFELVVTEKSVGTLSTNIEALEKFAEERLKDYSPENYMGDSDLAKKDRAELNKAVDAIATARKNLIKELMKPYSDFEERCKKLEKRIAAASASLDEIVKIKENEEKSAKKELIKGIWENKKFELFDLEKVFNPKWLNKTAKLTDVAKEIDSIIEKTYKDLKLIERFSDDAENLKAHYLMNLNIEETMEYGDELIRQKEIAQKEAEEREEREHQQKLEQQKEELWKEESNFEKEQEAENLAQMAIAAANGEEPPAPVRSEYVVTVKCFPDELLKLKSCMNELGIEFSVEELTF